MARAHFETYLLDSEGRPIPGASVSVREPETVTLISETLYAQDTPDTTTKTNPFTADADGRIVIYLENPKVVDLFVEKTGYEDRTVRATAHQLTSSTLVFKDAGISMNQRAGVNFTDGFVLTDDAVSDETEVAIDFGEDADISTQAFGDAPSAGTGTEPPLANHKHGMPVDPVTAHTALPDAHQARSHDHSAAGDGTALAPASVAPSVSLTIPGASSPAQTAEGSAVWDTDDDVLTVGDGTSRKQFGKLGTAAAGASAFADVAAAGSSLEAARIDHKHGREATPITAHEAAADPHTGYQKETEKNVASGYAPLDASVELPDANLKAHTPEKHSAVMAQIVKAADQSIASGVNLGTLVQVSFSSATFDDSSIFNDAFDKFVVPTAGRWRFTFHLVLELPTTSHRLRALIYKNGAQISYETNSAGTSDTDGPTVTCSVVSDFIVNDEVTFYAAHNEGTNQNVLGDGTLNTTHAEAEFLGV